VLGENATVDGGGRELGKGVERVPTLEHRRDARRSQRRVPASGRMRDARHRGRVAMCHGREIGTYRTVFDSRHRAEVRARDLVDLERKGESRQAVESAGQVVDGIVRYGKRAVAALV